MALALDIKSIDQICDGLTPTSPLNLDDSIAIWDLLRPIVKGEFKLDVRHDKTAIHVKVYDGRGLMVYSRELNT